jgi:hypothetical protein
MARNAETPPPDDKLALVHPVYLDVPMMVSFLAALQDGVSFQDESIRRSVAAAEREREGKGGVRAGIPGLGQLFGFDLSGRMAGKDRDEDSEEVKAVRQHTAASLFNSLHHFLHRDGYVTILEEGLDPNDLEIGDLVEVTGRFVGNPLQQILAFFGQVLPYLGIEEQGQQKPSGQRNKQKGRGQGGGGQQRGGNLPPEIEMLKQMQSDLDEAPVHDAVLEGPGGLQIILTMSSEFLTRATSEQLRTGNFTALGKVTRVLAAEDEVNLARRTVLNAAPEVAEEMVSSLRDESEINLDVGRSRIEAPAVQLLPLAVFI